MITRSKTGSLPKKITLSVSPIRVSAERSRPKKKRGSKSNSKSIPKQEKVMFNLFKYEC